LKKEQLVIRSDKPYSCGLGPAFDVIGGKWKAVILWELHDAPLRFGELKRRIPAITEKMLIQQLREMQSDGLVMRKMYHEVPPRVEYSLSKSGQTLNDSLETLAEWGKMYAAEHNIIGRYIV
jgi:DNA-binding HxlR family transcriptional regulator